MGGSRGHAWDRLCDVECDRCIGNFWVPEAIFVDGGVYRCPYCGATYCIWPLKKFLEQYSQLQGPGRAGVHGDDAVPPNLHGSGEQGAHGG